RPQVHRRSTAAGPEGSHEHRHSENPQSISESRKNMAELTISSDEIRSAIENYTASYSPEASREEVGVVTDTSDGIAHISGLPSVMSNELLEFAGGVKGVALNLEAREIGAVVLGEFEGIAEGQEVRRTGE